jgi:hypothetical protein
MINLLPPEGRSLVKREYWLRVLSAYAVLLTVAFVITIVVLLPTYFHVAFQINTVIEDIANVGSAEDFARLEGEIKTANAISSLLVKSTAPIPATTIIAEIKKLAEATNTIEGITISTKEGVVDSVVVTGSAKTRSTLVGMRDRIEAHEYFETVELPISNLAKDENIPFSLTIKPSTALSGL